MNKILTIFACIYLVSCVPKSDYDDLVSENKKLNKDVERLEKQLSILKSENDKLQDKIFAAEALKKAKEKDNSTANNVSGNSTDNNTDDRKSRVLEIAEKKRKEKRESKTKYSEETAIRLVKEYFDFYKSDTPYRKIKLKRMSNNTFNVSLEICLVKGFCEPEYAWKTQLYYLKIVNNERKAFFKLTS